LGDYRGADPREKAIIPAKYIRDAEVKAAKIHG
jgi:hypothetical protein